MDLREIVRNTTDDLAAVFARAGVELKVEHVPRAVWIDADATRMTQVLGNILQNAAKFTPTGGSVVVSLAIEDGRAVLRVRAATPAVRSRISRVH